MGLDRMCCWGCWLIACIGCAIALWRLRRTARRQRDLLDRLPQTALTAFDRDLRVTFTAAGPLAALPARTAAPRASRCSASSHRPSASRCCELPRRSCAVSSVRSSTARPRPVAITGSGLSPSRIGKGEVTGGLAVALDISDRRTGQAGSMGRRTTRRRGHRRHPRARPQHRSVDRADRRVQRRVPRRRRPGRGAARARRRRIPTRLEVTASVGAELRGLTIALDPTAEDGARARLRGRRGNLCHAATRTTSSDLTDRDFMRRARVRSVLWHPVVRDHEPVGLLAIGWREPVAGISLRLQSMIELLGAEAAVAIGRADMLGELERLARTDELTGLPNRRDWEERLPSELARASRAEQAALRRDARPRPLQGLQRQARAPGRRPAAGRGGHGRGMGVLRPYDVLARYGGEEFSLLLPDVDLDDAVALVERLRAATPDGESCSAGIAAWDGEEDAAVALVGRADAALYEAKRAGRDRVAVASPRLRLLRLGAQRAHLVTPARSRWCGWPSERSRLAARAAALCGLRRRRPTRGGCSASAARRRWQRRARASSTLAVAGGPVLEVRWACEYARRRPRPRTRSEVRPAHGGRDADRSGARAARPGRRRAGPGARLRRVGGGCAGSIRPRRSLLRLRGRSASSCGRASHATTAHARSGAAAPNGLPIRRGFGSSRSRPPAAFSSTTSSPPARRSPRARRRAGRRGRSAPASLLELSA